MNIPGTINRGRKIITRFAQGVTGKTTQDAAQASRARFPFPDEDSLEKRVKHRLNRTRAPVNTDTYGQARKDIKMERANRHAQVSNLHLKNQKRTRQIVVGSAVAKGGATVAGAYVGHKLLKRMRNNGQTN